MDQALVLVPVVAVGGVAVAAVHVVEVVAVLDRHVSAAWAVAVGVREMPDVIAGV
jgi:uncharacterized membrane protein